MKDASRSKRQATAAPTSPTDRDVHHRRTAELEAAETGYRRAADEVQRQSAQMAALSELAIELAAASPDTDVFKLIAEAFRSITGAVAASFSIYDAQRKELVVRYLASANPVLSIVNRLLGRNLIGMRMPVSPEIKQRMLTTVVTTVSDMSEVTFGVVPKPVASAIQTALGLGDFVGLSLHYADELVGSAVVVMPNRQPPLPMDLMRTFAHVAAVSLRRKQAEEALRESEERYRGLFERVPVGLYRTSPAGEILSANPALVEMLGYPDEKSLLAANAVEVFVEPGDREREQLLLAREGIVRHFETQLRCHDGASIWVLDSARAVRDAEGRVLYYEGTLEDITQRKELEEQVRQQERLAAVGQLAGGIAHDFNNLLTTIILDADILLRKPHLPADMRGNLEAIIDESRRAAQLVQQILDFSRRSMMHVRPVDLTPPIMNTVDILRRTLPETIHLDSELEASACVVKADPARLQQALMNLATNARDAMPDGGRLRIGLACIEVALGEEAPMAGMPPGQWVCLTVSDTGTGMTEEVQAHLFEPFFTTKPVGKGTGLGLAQVYGIVKQHKGYIGVDTEMGLGTTVRIYLPLHEVQAMADVDRASEKAPEVAPAAPKGKGEAILLVEDNERIREVGRTALESLGYCVLTAENGLEALEVYRSAAGIALVIVDMVMPEMGGKQLMRELRKTRPDLKGLIITGYALKEDLQQLKEEGIVDIVRKPFDRDTLAQSVRRSLDAD